MRRGGPGCMPHDPATTGTGRRDQWQATATGDSELCPRSRATGDISGLKTDGRAAPLDRALGLRSMGACPRDAPELPSTANDRHRRQPANMKLGRALNLRATHENTLVMRSSPGGDEDQGAELPRVVRDSRRRARCVPDRPVNGGCPRSLADSPIHCLTRKEAA